MLRLVVRGLMDLLWPPRTRCLLCEGLLAGVDEPGNPSGTDTAEPSGLLTSLGLPDGEGLLGGGGRACLPSDLPVCRSCWEGMGFRPGVARCENCCRPTLGGDPLCADCASGSPYGRVFALGFHEGALREAIHFFKFGGRSELGRPLGLRLAPLVGERPDLVVPVPLHRSRLRERGYNQAAVLAEAIADGLGVPVGTGLVRLRSTGHQAKLDRSGRLHNLDGAFGAARQPTWVNKSVLLVDDVLTTGATAVSVATVLRRTGARAVNLAVLAVSATPVLGLSINEK